MMASRMAIRARRRRAAVRLQPPLAFICVGCGLRVLLVYFGLCNRFCRPCARPPTQRGHHLAPRYRIAASEGGAGNATHTSPPLSSGNAPQHIRCRRRVG